MKVLYNDGHVDECPADEITHVIRHSAAHIMAQAIKRLYPEADFAYGPATDNGFYYDVDLGEKKISEEDFPAIEAEMKKICKENLKFTTFELPREEAVALMQERGVKIRDFVLSRPLALRWAVLYAFIFFVLATFGGSNVAASGFMYAVF